MSEDIVNIVCVSKDLHVPKSISWTDLFASLIAIRPFLCGKMIM